MLLTKRGKLLYNMHIEDFVTVFAFLTSQRDKLERKEFFYPYTEQELRQILENGIFFGLFDADRLIATFGIDRDEEYAVKLAEIVTECTRGRLAPRRAYEVSGFMVDSDYRGQGIASVMMQAVLDRAAQLTRSDWLCGVVQLENVASMRVFLKNGFVLGGVWQMGGEYDFGYFVRPVAGVLSAGDVEYACAFRDIARHKELLAQGYVGKAIEGYSRIAYGKANES